MTKKALCLMLFLFTIALQAQELIKCSPEKTFWLIKEGGKNYAVMLHGEIKESNHPNIIVVGGKALQYLLVDKKAYVDKAGNTDDLKVLATYVSGESSYIISRFMASMEITNEAVALGNGKTAIYWSYTMPEGKNDEVDMQHFLNVIEGDKILGLAITQFKGDDAKEIKQMLLDVLDTLTVVKDGENLCKQ